MSKKEQMFALVKQWRESGLTRGVFVKQHGLEGQSFDYWCQKQYNEVVKSKSSVRTSPKTPSSLPRFIELTSAPANCHVESQQLQMELELPGGIRIKIY